MSIVSLMLCIVIAGVECMTTSTSSIPIYARLNLADALAAERDPRARVEVREPRQNDIVGHKLTPNTLPHGDNTLSTLDPPT